MVSFRPSCLELVSVRYPFGLSLSKAGRCLGAVRTEPVGAGGCWFGGRAGVQGGSRESPGVRVTFFCFAKRKSPKKRRPPVCDPFAALRGRPVAGRLRGAPQNSLRCFAAPFGQLRRVSSRSMGASTPMPPHNRPAAGAASRGWAAEHLNTQTAEQPHGPLLRSAPPAQRVALAPVRWGRAKQWPVWMSDSRVPFTMCRGAQGVGRHGRLSARASCSDSLRLSERSAQRVASSAARPTHEHRRLPAAKRRDAARRVALSLVTFFRRDERKLLRRRAHTPAPAPNSNTPPKPARQGFDKLSPSSYTSRHSIATPLPAMARDALKSIAKSAC